MKTVTRSFRYRLFVVWCKPAGGPIRAACIDAPHLLFYRPVRNTAGHVI